jgi:hypothetical protein
MARVEFCAFKELRSGYRAYHELRYTFAGVQGE